MAPLKQGPKLLEAMRSAGCSLVLIGRAVGADQARLARLPVAFADTDRLNVAAQFER